MHTPFSGTITAQDFGKLDPKEFEDFSLMVLRQYYQHQNVEIIATPYCKDGGKDAAISWSFGDSKMPEELAVTIKIWMEAKHHDRNIGLYVAGRHWLGAYLGMINKLIFVCSKDFSSTLEIDFEQLRLRSGISTSIINGQRLCELYNNLQVEGVVALKPPSIATQTRRKALTEASLKAFFANTQLKSCFFSPHKSLVSHSPDVNIYSSKNIPIFLHATVVSKTLESDIGLDTSSLQIQLRSKSSGEMIAQCRCILSHTIPVQFLLPKEVVERFDDYSFEIVLRSLEYGIDFEHRIDLHQIENKITPSIDYFKVTLSSSQDKIYTEIKESFKEWCSNPSIKSVALTAAAGVGKSTLINELRHSWLKHETDEIYLDGKSNPDLGSFLYNILAHLLPLRGRHFVAESQEQIINWLTSIDIDKGVAHSLANIVCGIDAERIYSDDIYINTLQVIFDKLMAYKPYVVIFEDIHFADSKVIKFLAGLLRQSDQISSSAIFFVFTSRHIPEAQDEQLMQMWLKERSQLLKLESMLLFELHPLTKGEQKKFIQNFIPNIDDVYIEPITKIVGGNPYFLVAALQVLRQEDVIEFDINLQDYILLQPEKIRVLFENINLRSLIHKRLEYFIHYYTHFSKTIAALSAYGFEFNWEQLNTIIGVFLKTKEEKECFMQLSLQEGILAVRPLNNSYSWSFNHDLLYDIQISLLASPSNKFNHLNILETLHELMCEKGKEETQLRYYLQIGNTEKFIEIGKTYSAQLIENHAYHQACQILMSVDQILERSAMADMKWIITDPIYKYFTPNHIYSGSQREIDELQLEIKEKAYLALNRITSGSSDFVQSLISQTSMVARRLKSMSHLIKIKGWEGEMYTQRGEDDKSLAAYDSAVKYMNDRDYVHEMSNAEKAEIYIGLAISQRLNGEHEKSLESLLMVRKNYPDEPLITVRVEANLGALYFYTDRKERRGHWQRGYEIAKEANLRDNMLHMILDLASLDLLDDEFEHLQERLDIALKETNAAGLENSLMRGLIMQSSIDLINGRYQSASECLKQAQSIGYKHSITRRIWKIHGNLASLAEAQENWEESYKQDLAVIKKIPQLRAERRVCVSLGNIALRATESSLHKELLDSLSHETQEIAGEYALKAQRLKHKDLYPYEHVKIINGKRRYIMS